MATYSNNNSYKCYIKVKIKVFFFLTLHGIFQYLQKEGRNKFVGESNLTKNKAFGKG